MGWADIPAGSLEHPATARANQHAQIVFLVKRSSMTRPPRLSSPSWVEPILPAPRYLQDRDRVEFLSLHPW
jgi:hypothetical protein